MPSLSLRSLDEYVGDLPSGDPAWVQIAPILERPVESPAFLLGDLPAEMTYAFFAETRTGPVRCYRLRQVNLTADGIVLAGENVLWTTLLNHPRYHVASITGELPTLGAMPGRRVAGPAVMLSGPGSHIYGHWLVDVLPRLFVLASCGYELAKLQFIVSASLPRFCHEFLQLLGIVEDQLIRHDERGELLEVEELLLPTNLRIGSQIHPLMKPAVAFLRDRISARSSVEPHSAPNRRLFVSREGGEPSRLLQNRGEIEAIAVAEGYEIVSPETLAIPEQIAMFASAAQIIGEYGSGLHNSVFAPPATVVMALRGTSHHPGFIQSGLGQVFRQPTGYVFSPTPIEAVDQLFRVSADAFRLGLRCAGLLARRGGRAAA